MKRITALFLVLILASALIACSNSNTATSPSASGSAAPSASASASPLSPSPSLSPSQQPSPGETDTVGFITDKVDHFSRDPYKFATMSVNTHNAFNEAVNDTYTKWGTVFNYTVYHYDANMDYDAYINQIQIFSDQGYQGLFMMVDDALRDRAYDLTQELKMPCIGMPTAFADSEGHVIWPSVVQDEYGNGALCVQWLADNYPKYWKDPIDTTKLGLIAIDFSPISGIHARMPGIQDAFVKNFPEAADNYFVADLVTNSNGFSVQGANEMTAAIISSNSQIAKWFVVACVDDWAVGAERAVETLNKNEDVLIVSNQADAFGNELKTGSRVTSYVAACAVSTTELTGYTSAYLCAILDGRATAETIWPQYIKAGDKYPCIVCKGTMLTKDTYDDWMQKNSFETVSAGMKLG